MFGPSDVLEYVKEIVEQLADLCRAIAPPLAADLDNVATRARELLEAHRTP